MPYSYSVISQSYFPLQDEDTASIKIHQNMITDISLLHQTQTRNVSLNTHYHYWYNNACNVHYCTNAHYSSTTIRNIATTAHPIHGHYCINIFLFYIFWNMITATDYVGFNPKRAKQIWSRQHSKIILFFWRNKTWYFMWIICLALSSPI